MQGLIMMPARRATREAMYVETLPMNSCCTSSRTAPASAIVQMNMGLPVWDLEDLLKRLWVRS
jgi:hypothetical protein